MLVLVLDIEGAGRERDVGVEGFGVCPEELSGTMALYCWE
jgi:hypothetical protein